MQKLLFISLLFFLGCNEKPKDNFELNKELQQSRARIERLENLNDSLWNELFKCDFLVESLEDTQKSKKNTTL